MMYDYNKANKYKHVHTMIIIYMCICICMIYFYAAAKPLIPTEFVRIIMKERNNILLTCGVQYAYPLPTIEWHIMTPLSDEYTLIQESTTNYKLLSNGSVEFLHRFLFEMGYIKVKCSAHNPHGSGNSNFDLWENEVFMKSKFSYVCYHT